MRTRIRSSLLVAMAALSGTVLSLQHPAAAQAAPPPSGYPTSEVMSWVSNPAYSQIPIRRGFYDGDNGHGFGMDKAWHKHAITTLLVSES